MPSFGERSLRNLSQVHPDLVRLCEAVIEITDFAVICGHRGEAEQNALYGATPQRSKVRWPDSKHNSLPSRAIDVAPYPIDWSDREAFARLAGIFIGVAHGLGIDLRWGGDWDRDGQTDDEEFSDLPHIELR